MNIQLYFAELRALYAQNGNPETAEQQRAYMKDNFEYFGLKAPIWTALLKQFTKKNAWPTDENLYDFVDLCYADEHREMHYAAIEAVQKNIKKCPKTYISLLEHLVVTHSWWDTVDWLAKLIGMYFLQYPEQIKPVTERWMDSNHLWLQRESIIFQLFYREKTNTDLMFDYILRTAHSKEFFLQKAGGWALRQHSKTNPDLIERFIQQQEALLSTLTKREGMRLILKNRAK